MDIFRSLIEPFLITRKLKPENQETPIHFLNKKITPTEYFFIRNHFDYPKLTEQAFFLPVEGKVKRSVIFSYENIMRMPSKTLVLPLECSGNKRAYFKPEVYGEQWKDGAISQGIWKGIPLYTLLALTGLERSALEVVFEAYDYGKREDLEGIFDYKRSLPLQKALHSDTLIAYELNGKPIPFKHGIL